MNKPSIEQRITNTLHEVANRLPHRDVELLALPAPLVTRRRPWLTPLVAAAVALTVLAAGVLTRDRGGRVPLATQAPRTLLSADVEDTTANLVTSRAGCVTVVFRAPFDRDQEPEACTAGQTFAITATIRAGKTIVYGLASRGERFSVGVASRLVPPADLRQVAVGDGAVFLFVVDGPDVSGTVSVHDSDGRVIATESFDHGGPARPPKGTIGHTPMAFAFWRDGAVWVRTGDERDVRLTDGTQDAGDGHPSVAPNGQSIAYSVANFEGIFDQPRIIDARDGKSADLPAFVRTFSPDGSLIAGGQPVDDSGAATELVVLRSRDFGEVARISVAVSDVVGDIASVAWDRSGTRILLVTSVHSVDEPPQRTDRLWLVDLARRSAVEVGEHRKGVEWFLAEHAAEPGVFTAIRRERSTVDWGVLRVDSRSARFDRVRALPAGTPDGDFDLTGRLYVDGHSADSSRYLIGDGRNLFLITRAGDLTFLFADVEFASAP